MLRGNGNRLRQGKWVFILKILVVVNGKGGVGKIIIVVNLVVILVEKRLVFLVDVDFQGFVSWWVECSGDKMGFYFS